ncbi:hypothetical protein [Streptomyces luteireticuli]|uniref:SMI1/KNR4 family protein n=1 Tax=Streptomyces luteireticuli TaxID=173858 RepID=A0ABP3IPR5_9ACTN
MAQRLSRQEFDVDVNYHRFGLQEDDDALLPVPYPDDFEYGQFLQVFPGRLDLFSAGHSHAARLVAEVWDSRPEEVDPAHNWEVLEEASLTVPYGELAIWDTGRTEDIVNLGGGGDWGVRAASSGRAEVARITEQAGTAEGVEQYLLQFWPLR